MTRPILTAILALATTLALPLPLRAQAPAETTIVPDGDFSDWEQVLTNPLNAARDADGHSISCAFSTDRDCIVTGAEHDLTRFAWTWSGTDWAFFLERFGNSGGWEWFWVFLDTNLDGMMEAGEPVLRLRLNGDGVDNELAKFQYVSSQPGVPDPMVDIQGFADGHHQRGSETGPEIPLSTDLGASIDGRRYEGLVSTAFLGVLPGGPMRFHVTASSNSNIPGSIEDNMGGRDGGIGTTEYRLVSAGPDSETSSGPGLTHLVSMTLCNDGNLPSRINYSVQSTLGYDVELWQDVDGTGFPAVYLGLDNGGDADMTRSQDDLSLAGDPNGDLLLDTGVLATGDCFTVLLEQTYPNNANGAQEDLLVRAWQDEDPSVLDEGLAIVWLGRLTLLPDRSLFVQDGDTAWLAHVVTNNTDTAERVDFRAVSARAWSTGLWLDPNGDGDPADAVAMVDSDGSGLPDLVVPSNDSVAIFTSLMVPLGTSDGQADAVTVDALIGGNARATANDRVEVIPAIDIAPDYLLSAGNERYGAVGGSVYFAHRLRNGQGTTDTFSLQTLSSSSWNTVLLDDPDGDGRPHDSSPLSPAELTVPGGGGEGYFLVRVDIPDGSLTGTNSRIDVIAQSQTDAGVAAAAADDAIAAIVLVFDDSNYGVNVRRFSPCTTVYARANGLPASTGGFRFAWRDTGGALVQSVSVSTDAEGVAVSTYDLLPSDSGADWSVDIDLWNAGGNVWVTQDTAPFNVENDLTTSSLLLSQSAYHLADADVTATVDLLNSGLVDVLDIQLRWVLLSPAGDAYLRSSGNFALYTGIEATATDSISRINAGQTKTRTFSIAGVNFPSTGTYSLALHAAASCGGESLAGAANFEVVDDQDFDGLSLAEETLAGTDPTDADSDDDGLLDAADGVGDSDLDGLVDALDCDSDNDGLLDGVEAGVWYHHPDTASGSSCDAFDLWPGTVTDPDDPDTDGGGVPDGLEDLDGNGRLDAGELDPLDPADDRLADSDGDGARDLDELSDRTDPLDPDSDDDGLLDGVEQGRDSDGDGTVDGLECDSDGDGLPDGLEAGVSSAPAGTDEAAGCFVPDADPGSVTDPGRSDSDGSGVDDGSEDLNGDGALDPGETDPTDPLDDDSDLDGLPNLAEDARGTERFDRDSDDDGVIDGAEPDEDSDGDGVPDALECDSDGDGLPDGLELGLSSGDADTDLAAGCFVADADPASTTDPTRADSDGAGVPDGAEDLDLDGSLGVGETDPADPFDDDSDFDGLPNLAEDAMGTDRFDRDSDDDGLPDGAELDADSDGDGVPDALECDSDGDGLPDGLERGLVSPDPDTDLGAGCFVADGDPASTTDPASADSDGAGVPDGVEDADGDGIVDPDETDPRRADDDDSDLDGLPNLQEDLLATDRFDRDSDDDGVLDGDEAVRDSDGDGLSDALECDSDGDGLHDGLERGLTVADADTDLAAGCFVVDADPATTSDPTSSDSDGGGVADGLEDVNGNGRVDPGERDPALAADDSCSTGELPEVTDLRVLRLPSGAVRLTWAGQADACATYTAWSWGEQADRPELVSGLTQPETEDPGVFRPGPVVYYRVAAVSSVSGVGAGGP